MRPCIPPCVYVRCWSFKKLVAFESKWRHWIGDVLQGKAYPAVRSIFIDRFSVFYCIIMITFGYGVCLTYFFEGGGADFARVRPFFLQEGFFCVPEVCWMLPRACWGEVVMTNVMQRSKRAQQHQARERTEDDYAAWGGGHPARMWLRRRRQQQQQQQLRLPLRPAACCSRDANEVEEKRRDWRLQNHRARSRPGNQRQSAGMLLQEDWTQMRPKGFLALVFSLEAHESEQGWWGGIVFHPWYWGGAWGGVDLVFGVSNRVTHSLTSWMIKMPHSASGLKMDQMQYMQNTCS